MEKYKSIYSFNVIDEIKHGANVCMLDRKEMEVECVENMEVGDFASVLAISEKEKDRFEFWKVIKEGEEV